MKKILITLLLIFSLPISAMEMKEAEVEDIPYVSGFEDLPLMDGLVEHDEPLVFDSVHGSIVQTTLETETLTFNEIIKYYDEVLLSLGWVKKGKGVYEREEENLTIEVVEKGPPLLIKFELN